MMSTIEADDAWCPPTLTPLEFGRPRLAASTIAVDSQSTRCEIARSSASSTAPHLAVPEEGSELAGADALAVMEHLGILGLLCT